MTPENILPKKSKWELRDRFDADEFDVVWTDEVQTNLVGAPPIVNFNFEVRDNRKIKSLKGCPKEVHCEFVIDNLKSLHDIDHLPKKIKTLYFRNMYLKSFIEIAKESEIEMLVMSGCFFSGGPLIELLNINADIRIFNATPDAARLAIDILRPYLGIPFADRTFEDYLKAQQELIEADLEKYCQ